MRYVKLEDYKMKKIISILSDNKLGHRWLLLDKKVSKKMVKENFKKKYKNYVSIIFELKPDICTSIRLYFFRDIFAINEKKYVLEFSVVDEFLEYQTYIEDNSLEELFQSLYYRTNPIDEMVIESIIRNLKEKIDEK